MSEEKTAPPVASARFANTRALQATPQVLARNTLFNLIGQVLVAATAVICLPFIVQALGNSAYGILSLTLVMLGAVGVLELGLGRATTKFVAEYLSSGSLDHVNSVVWTSFAFQVFLGLLGGVILAIAVPLLAGRVLHVPPQLTGEAQRAFYLLAAAIPFVLGSSALRGALEGSQRFDLINSVKVVLNLSTYLIPLAAGLAGLPISGIVLLLVVTRVLAALAYLVLCLHVLPVLRQRWQPRTSMIPKLFSYAGWVAVSNIITPVLSQTDRFLIAAILTVEAVTFYVVPYEILNALWIIPGSIAAALFPAFSGLKSRDDPRLADLYARPLTYILVALGPAVLSVAAFSEGILLRWQGSAFAEQSALVLQILVVGVLINSLEWVPANLIMGFGRPDITAIAHLIQLPLFLGMAYLLIQRWGIVGAAAAFTLRVTFEAVLIFGASWLLAPVARRSLSTSRLSNSLLLLLGLALSFFAIQRLSVSLEAKALLSLLGLVAYAGAAWALALDRTDRQLAMSLIPFARKASRAEGDTPS